MSFVLGLIILVAACTVIATLIMVVLEKKKEIALLKALGAKNDAILRIFLYQGGIIGAGGDGARPPPRLAFVPVPHRCTRSRSTPRSTSSPACRCRCTPLEFVVPARVAIGICLVATILPGHLRGAASARADGPAGRSERSR